MRMDLLNYGIQGLRNETMDLFEKVTLGIFISGVGILFMSAGVALMKLTGVF